MAHKTKHENRRRAQSLARRLEKHEKLLERLESVIDLVEDEGEGSLDQIEYALADELRKLGSESLGSWVERREEALAQQVRAEHGKAQEREKKTSTSTRASGKSR